MIRKKQNTDSFFWIAFDPGDSWLKEFHEFEDLGWDNSKEFHMKNLYHVFS